MAGVSVWYNGGCFFEVEIVGVSVRVIWLREVDMVGVSVRLIRWTSK